MALTEAIAAIDRLTDEAIIRADLEDAVRRQGTAPTSCPSISCLDDALALPPSRCACPTPSISPPPHLPRPLTYVTFDPTQIPVALALGFEVVST